MYHNKAILIILLVFIPLSLLLAQPISSKQIDSVVEKTLKTFNVPGIAVAVVKDGKVIHEKGYGIRSLNTGKKVDEHTLFGIASNSKAFTTAALGMLVDEGKLNWDDRVTDIIPYFKLYNPYVSENFTVRDLVTHRSGLGLGAGDLMIWPDSSTFTKSVIIHNLRYLKPVSDFRTKYDYDNLLFIVAGEVVASKSGMSWEEFIENRIMQPLGMTESAASLSRVKDKTNVIDPHVPVNGKLQVIGIDWSETANAAGGIYSNVHDLTKWIIMQMNNGEFDDGKQLFSKRVHEEMWTPQTIIPVRGKTTYNTHFASYGLGWFLSDEEGYKVATHTGGLAGIVTQITLIPEMQLGIIVLTNQQSGAAFTSITNTIKDSYYGLKGENRIDQYAARVAASQQNADSITTKIWKEIGAQQQSNTAKPDLKKYLGTYKDPWFGEVEISMKGDHLYFASKNSPRMAGNMYYYKGNTFVIKWNNRSMDADAFALFGANFNGDPTTIKMEAISPLTDFSFDFQDLDFTRVK